MVMLRKAGMASRTADLRIDAAAKAGAQAVRAAPNHDATARFLSRFLDHLHNDDNEARGLYDPLSYPDMNSPGRRRGRKQSG